jgi:uncharacterized protein
LAISRAQCLSIVVGFPGLACGIASTVEEAAQIIRLCRIMQAAAASCMAALLDAAASDARER